MDDFTRKAEQSCHMGVYDRGNVLISAQINSPSDWSFAAQRGARVSAAQEVLLKNFLTPR